MSGFAAILNPDDRPVDVDLLADMGRALLFRGPHAQQSWNDGPAGLVHTLLRTAFESENERQPFTLDGETYIVSDARIDAREELSERLRSRGRNADLARPDVELILHAYHAWGEECVQNLLGDFAFVIWDGRERKLYAARDHLGAKPLYYAQADDSFLFSNTLDCIRRHPRMSGELNPLAIADFLLFGYNNDPRTTTFRDVQRVPPAHCAVVKGGRLSVRRYWELPVPSPRRYRSEAEYLENFNEVMACAVRERLRQPRVALRMSGGVDSGTVAAFARKVACASTPAVELKAFTAVFEKLIPDTEREFAAAAGDGLAIPIEFMPQDDCKLFECRPPRTPEPYDDPLLGMLRRHCRRVATFSCVALTGEGGDGVVRASLYELLRHLRSLHWWGPARGILAFYRTYGRLPQFGIRSRVRRWFSAGPEGEFPAWIQPGLDRELGLRERWRQFWTPPAWNSAVRPEAYAIFCDPYWAYSFESYDAAVTNVPVEFRHPILDVRVLNYSLSLPSIPWCLDKEVFRRSTAGVLPDNVRLRRKAPLRGEPILVLLRQSEAQWIEGVSLEELRQYVAPELVPLSVGSGRFNRLDLRPVSLKIWLEGKERERR